MLAEELLEFVNATVRQKTEDQTLEVRAVHAGYLKCLYDTLCRDGRGRALAFCKRNMKTRAIIDP